MELAHIHYKELAQTHFITFLLFEKKGHSPKHIKHTPTTVR